MDLVGLFGAGHPALVHLPVGGAIILAVIELAGWRDPAPWRAARLAVLAVAAGGALLAAAAGWIHAGSEGYADAKVADHRLAGMVATILLVGLVAGEWWAPRWSRLPWTALRRIALAVAVATTLIAGHLGGLIADPSRYARFLASPAAQPEASTAVPMPQPATAASAMALAVAATRPPAAPAPAPGATWTEIAVILAERCTECHNAVKRKGGVRFDAYEHLRRLGASRVMPVTPGQPQGSALFQRISLPADHEDRMPPDPHPPLPAAQVELIRAWIANGAPGPAAVAATAAAPTAPAPIRLPKADAPSPVEQAARDQLTAAGAQVYAWGQGWGVNLRHVPGALDARIWQPLAALSARVAAVDATGRSLDAADAGRLAALPRLERLDLTRASVAEGALARLAPATALRTLVLTGAQVRGDPLPALAKLPLTTVYIRGSSLAASAAAVAAPGRRVIE